MMVDKKQSDVISVFIFDLNCLCNLRVHYSTFCTGVYCKNDKRNYQLLQRPESSCVELYSKLKDVILVCTARKINSKANIKDIIGNLLHSFRTLAIVV